MIVDDGSPGAKLAAVLQDMGKTPKQLDIDLRQVTSFTQEEDGDKLVVRFAVLRPEGPKQYKFTRKKARDLPFNCWEERALDESKPPKLIMAPTPGIAARRFVESLRPINPGQDTLEWYVYVQVGTDRVRFFARDESEDYFGRKIQVVEQTKLTIFS